MIYLDNAATSFPKPAAVAEAMGAFLASAAVNPGRSGFDLSLAVGRRIDGIRARLDRLFNNPARDPDRTVFALNATAALNFAIQGSCRPGDHVVSTVLEHNSVLRPLAMMRKAGLITYDLAGCDATGRVDPADIAALIGPSTRLVVMTHASNVCGTLQPAAEVGSLCRERDILFLLDAAQTAGLLPVDMEALQADLVAFTGHKSLLGPTGTGGLVVGPRADIASTVWGGTGVRSSEMEHPVDYPWRLEAGTQNTVGLVGLEAALSWLESEGQEKILAHESSCADRFLAGCAALAGVTIHGFGNRRPAALGEDRLPVVSLTVAGRSPEETGLFLDTDWDVAVRTGLHCAPLAHAALGTGDLGSVRFSFGPFTTDQDVATTLEALASLAG
jgi:cysteine desulfurase family protein